MASQFLPVVLGNVPDEPLPMEPTFYLGGQPYIYDECEVGKAGPEFASTALVETRNQLVRLYALYHADEVVPEEGCRMTREQFVHRATELASGIAGLATLVGPLGPVTRRMMGVIGGILGPAMGLVVTVD